MALGQLIAEIRRDWPAYRGLSKVSSREHVYDLVVGALPAELGALVPPGPAYELEGSTGRGNITSAPWVATYDQDHQKCHERLLRRLPFCGGSEAPLLISCIRNNSVRKLLRKRFPTAREASIGCGAVENARQT